MSVFPKELLDCLGIALPLKENRRLLVVSREEVDGRVAADIDRLGRVVESGVHLGNDQIGGAVSLQLLQNG